MTQTDHTLWKYAPLWATLFASAATLTKAVGTRYILNRRWRLSWKDAATAVGGALVGYATFRMRHGDKHDNAWFKR